MARQPAIQTPRGVIRCAYCRTDEYGLPPGPDRIDVRHVGLRLGDQRVPSAPWHVLLDGEDVTEFCVEAYAGDDGWVAVYDTDVMGHRYKCPTGPGPVLRREHAVVVKKWGRVDVVRVPNN